MVLDESYDCNFSYILFCHGALAFIIARREIIFCWRSLFLCRSVFSHRYTLNILHWLNLIWKTRAKACPRSHSFKVNKKYWQSILAVIGLRIYAFRSNRFRALSAVPLEKIKHSSSDCMNRKPSNCPTILNKILPLIFFTLIDWSYWASDCRIVAISNKF